MSISQKVNGVMGWEVGRRGRGILISAGRGACIWVIFNYIVKLTLPPHIKNKPRLSRKNDKAVKIMKRHKFDYEK